MTVIFDASALLAIVFEEAGAERAIAYARGGIASTVNMDEVLHKSARRGLRPDLVEAQITKLGIDFIPFDVVHARSTAALHPELSRLGISFADRACLALGLVSGHAILTADTDWPGLGLGIDIRLIR